MKINAVLAAALALAVLGADWPQWHGPHRDNVSRETGLLKEWPKDGPRLLWTYKMAGEGFSGPAVVGDRLYLLGARGDSEFVFALALPASPPKEVWATKIGPTFTWKGNNWNAGPSATATVDGDRVYALGGNGDLVCVESANGREKWRKSMTKDLGGEVNDIGGGPKGIGWGYAWSPLVDGQQVVCVPGGKNGTVAALNKMTGEVIWRSKELTEPCTYASPVVADIGKVRQYLIMTNKGVAGVAAKDGALLWNYQRENPYQDIVATTPIVRGDLVWISAAGTGGGSDLVGVSESSGKFTAKLIQASKELANFHGGVVLVGEQVYGASGDFGRFKWVCQDFKGDKVHWSREPRALGKGALTCADGHLYLLGEKTGVVMLVEATPTEWKVKGQFKLPETSKLQKPSAGFWTHPVIASGKLYLRDQELLYCFDVQGR